MALPEPTNSVGPRALVAIGESHTCGAVSQAFAEAGFDVAVAAGDEAPIARLQRSHFDLVILDLTASDGRGIDLVEEIRADGDDVPVVVIGAGDSERERILSLDVGADDYVSKPFSARELVSRGDAILRRAQRRPADGRVQTVGMLSIDLARHEVSLGRRVVEVTASEFRLLTLLSSRPGEVFTRRQIMEYLWAGPYFGDGHPVDTHMLNLRRKIEPDPARPTRLVTVRGVGFRLVAPAHESAPATTRGLESTDTGPGPATR